MNKKQATIDKDQRNNHYSLEYIKALKVLTPRQIEVLDGVAAGRTSREIGRVLNMSPRTAEKHCEKIRDKLGIRGHGNLFRWCRRHANGMKYPA